MPTLNENRLAQWRRDIVEARIRLADDHLPPSKERELWTLVDSRESCIRLSGADFDAELEQIDREIEAALRGSRRAV